MKGPAITTLKKYLQAMSKIKAKYITCERLSKVVGVYPEIIAESFSYFDPMINMDPTYDLNDLVPQVKDYIAEQEENRTHQDRSNFVTKKVVTEYESIGDFIYKKLTMYGIVDKNAKLSDKDLKILKRLINEEQARRKNKK